MAKKKEVNCGNCGQKTSDFRQEIVKPEHEEQKPYERNVGNDCCPEEE
jgi:hypothetical protein